MKLLILLALLAAGCTVDRVTCANFCRSEGNFVKSTQGCECK